MEISFNQADVDFLAEALVRKISETFGKQMNTRDALLTPDELASHLKVEKSWIYERTRDKIDGIPHEPLKFRVFIHCNKLVRFLGLPNLILHSNP